MAMKRFRTAFSLLRLSAAALATLAGARVAHAYALSGPAWANGKIAMTLEFASPGRTLLDGNTTWDAVINSMVADWNAQIVRSQLTTTSNANASHSSGNRVNDVYFSADMAGKAWGDGVLAVTLTRSTAGTSTSTMVEADVLFNSNLSWDSYRGTLRRVSGSTTILTEFRRVALHEFGHVLGLAHPDEATPAQMVSAIMNSRISNSDTLQTDDIAGVKSLYDSAAAAPIISTQPATQTVGVTGSYTLGVTAAGTGPLTYSWGFRAAGSLNTQPYPLATGPTYTIGSVQPADAGSYVVTVSNALGSTTSSFGTLTVSPLTTSPSVTLADISTRDLVGTGNNVLIAGFVIGGSTAKSVLVRAAGPGLADFGVSNPLAAPELSVVNSAGATVGHNAGWGTSADPALLASTFTRTGAFQFKSGSADSAVLLTLPPGNYTAIVNGVNGTTGTALVEAYDADSDATTARTRRLINISTRGQVGSGDNTLIAGLVVTGPGPRTYLVRAVGVTLADAPFNMTGVLSDPFLQIYDSAGNLLRENNDWDTPASAQTALRTAAAQVGAFALRETRPNGSGLDAAMLITLQPGAYTAKVSGANGASGTALVEIYEMPSS